MICPDTRSVWFTNSLIGWRASVKQVGDRSGRGVDVRRPRCDVAPAIRQSRNEFGQIVQPSANWSSRSAKVPSTVFRFVITSTDELVTARQGVRQRRCLRQDGRNGAALPLEHPQQFTGQRVDLIRVQRTEQRSETADQCVDVEGGRGARERNRLSGLQFAYRTGSVFQGEIAVADQILIPHGRLRALGQDDLVVDGELDVDSAVLVQGHVPDLADLDTGDAHEVAALEPRDVGEDRVVGACGVEPELAEHRNENEHEDEAHRGEQSDPRESLCVEAPHG